MNFASDNTAGVAPEIMAALSRVNEGFTLGYGNDAWTKRAEQRIAEVFNRDAAMLLVTTGTACNALAIAHFTPPWGAVLCHHDAHIMTDECGAPEFFGHGIKLVGLRGDGGKISPAILKEALEKPQWGAPHHVAPSVLSLSQATEAGTIYRPDEIRALADIAHAHNLAVHMDGARLGNALARMNAAPDEATWKAGVDVLSFGATKGGAMAAEAIVFFDRERAAGMDRRRKRGGHLLSKHRFVAAQMDAYLTDDLWLRLARHANAMADRLSDRLSSAGFAPVWPVEANEVFTLIPRSACDRLKAQGAAFYERMPDNLPKTAIVKPDSVLVRLVTSFATTAEEVDQFAALASA
ncbi:MAG: low specificity L-threonine aldolase [Pseudolabrys sp.]|nr:low specificity L-threonine aldolase [Pseudolabrys sp.]MDP2293960.1 low specificity L-threonine aldolase [Pseudolabrys sp.]